MMLRLQIVRRAVSTPIAVALTTVVVSGCASSAMPAGGDNTSPSHGSLTDREFIVAYEIARTEADRAAKSIISATATATSGTETEHNVGPPCTSGTLLHIKLIGEFNIVHGGVPGQTYEPVSAVLITADPESGKPCLLSVQTGRQAPESGATVLFTR